MLTYTNPYTTALASPFKENWLVRLYKNDGTYFGISFSDVTMGDSKAYTGAILNAPSIRESVNFTSGRSQNGNMTLEVANFDISSSTLLKTLYTGNYINQQVKVYSTLNANTDFANAPQIFDGRLESVSATEVGSVKLTIVVKRPWDDIELPNVVATNGVYAPVVYGDYTNNQYQSTENSKLYPAPYLTSEGIYLYYADHESEVNVFPHYYDKSARHFAWMARGSSASATTLGVDGISILDSVTRTYRIKPNIDATDTAEMTNPSNAVDDDDSTFAQSTHSVNDGTAEHDLIINLPQISGKVTALTMYLKFDVNYIDNEQSPSHFLDFDYTPVYSGSGTSANIVYDTEIAQSTETVASSGSANINNSGSSHSNYTLTSSVTSNNNKLPDTILFRHKVSQSNNNSNLSLDSTLKIYDIYFVITVQTDTANEPTSAGQEKAELDRVYLAHDGFNISWGSTLAKNPIDIHRDLLYRYLGITATPTNYSTVSSEKNGTMRFYTEIDKFTPIKNYLDKIAYEGGFVFRFRNDGTPVYHHIPNSPSVTSGLTLSHNDIIGLKISHSPLSELVTKFNVRFDKHPAKNEYKSSTSHTSGARSNFYVGSSKENVKEVKLNYLESNVAHTSGNRNASFLDYYNDIIGNVKQIVDFKLVNPTKSYIEVGDIINFDNSNMKIDALSGAWTNLKFIVTSTTRSVGGAVSVQVREI